MLPQKQAEEAIVPNVNETEHEGKEEDKESQSIFSVKNILWHGGSAWDAWFSCASNQVKRQKENPFLKFFYNFLKTKIYTIFVDFSLAGCSGSVNSAIFIFSAGNALWDLVSNFLWNHGKLDCLYNQCTVH